MPQPARRTVAALARRAAAALVVVLVAGCAAGGSRRARDWSRPTDAASAVAARSYGYGPVRNGSVTYQPDVVLIDGGPGVIRSASADGVVWTLAGDAPGVADLAVGKVMYATSRAVGRVADLRQTGGDVAVTLAPVGLTDVFRDAHFVDDREIGDAEAFLQEVPELPAASGVPADPKRTLKGATVPIGYRLGSDGQLPPAKTARTATVTVGDWEVQPYRGGGVLGLKVGRKQNDNLKFFADFSLKYRSLRVRSDVRVAGGKVDSNSTFALEGIESVAMDIAAGAANGSADNRKIRVEVPIEIPLPIPGEPLVYVTSWKFVASTAISGKNSTVKAGGEWRLDGPIGVIDGVLKGPSLSVKRSIIDSITGLSVGASGAVFAAETKVQFGIGIPAAFAGPYAKVVFSVGITNGSALGAPLARCIGATLDGKVGGGFGVSASSEALDALQKLLPKKIKFKLEGEKLKPFYHRDQTLPPVYLCGA
ncbi:hypothetical protein ONA91_15485 [Micromonospora sp. DR5-3]|uniref:hypothetical protein n=1 Tax=unclassified Micromonospora TaxID=2617518 RepID=UPI0011D790AA|nr:MULTISPECIES: hypothetical protein [unclassified Micromonospora]MCW3815846.1 hypothetical protein [Micromonospora sp. DR5-3]TYC24363.1 hypothetical protein FXF52_10125 [Micromonospora sp. MP36]